jgi:hypothetical protein
MPFRLRLILPFLIALLFINTSFAQYPSDSLSLNFDSLMSKMSSNQRDFKTMSARVRMAWNDGELEQEFTGNIRIGKDSVIWMSLGMMGIEGIRLLITPDSIYILNKLANEYAVRDLRFLEQWILFPVNFKMLQEIITGGKISIDERATLAAREDSSTVLYLESDKLQERIVLDTLHYTPEKILLKDKMLRQDLAIIFDAYNYSEPKPFSYQRSLTIHRDENTAVLHMDFNKVSFDEELSFPFEVNEKFKRVE